MPSSPHSFSHNPLIWDHFLRNIWHMLTMIKMFPRDKKSFIYWCTVVLNRTQEKHLFTLSLHSEGLEEAVSASNISFSSQKHSGTVVKPAQPSWSPSADVPLDLMISGFEQNLDLVLMKPVISWFDDVLLDAVIVKGGTPLHHICVEAWGLEVFHPKSAWIPEFFHYSHPPLL